MGSGRPPATVVGTDVVRFMAERAGATITEVEGSHVIMISQPQAVADVIHDRDRRGRDGWGRGTSPAHAGGARLQRMQLSNDSVHADYERTP